MNAVKQHFGRSSTSGPNSKLDMTGLEMQDAACGRKLLQSFAYECVCDLV